MTYLDSYPGVRAVRFGVAAVLLLAVAIVTPARAQFQDLATTDGGSRLLFSSPLRMRGSSQFPHAKLFALDAEGLKLLAQREEIRLPLPDGRLTNFFQLIAPDISGDGSVIAFTGRRSCFAGSGCLGVQYWESTFQGTPGSRAAIPGTARLSRNGRYAAVFDLRFAIDSLALVDLISGQSVGLVNYPQQANYLVDLPEPGRRVVSSNGKVVFTGTAGGQRGLWLGGANGIEELPASEEPNAAVIDDMATIVVYQAHSAAGAKLVAIDPAGGTERLLVASKDDISSPALSRDGQWLLFLSNADLTGGNKSRLAQVFLINTDGSRLRQLTTDASGIAAATLAGNGQIAYAATFSGKILRIDVPSAHVTEAVRSTWQAFSVNGDFVRGSINSIVGRGFVEETVVAEPPLPLELGGVRLRIGGVAVPLLSVSPAEIRWQLPWETPLSMEILDLELEVGSDSPFEGSAPTQLSGFVRRARPRFERLDVELIPGSNIRPYPLATHSDLRSPVTPASPARPGEIIHLYMTGLGPVDPPVATGAPGPSEPLASLVLPLRCSFPGSENTPAPEIVFAGLAPGLLGSYLVSLRVPQQTRSTELEFRCTIDAEDVFEYDQITIPIRTRPVAPRARGFFNRPN